MHTATLLRSSDFEVVEDGDPVDFDALFPGWGEHDRFGIVVTEPFGSLGASLLIEAATVCFYEAEPGRRDARPQYPEIHLFHVGGRHGDHGMFDFWPPRKEIEVEADPNALLDAVNDRAITRLAVPVAESDWTSAEPPISSFADRESARARIVSTFAYSPAGRVDGGELELSAIAETADENARSALDPEGAIAWYESLTEEEFREAAPGPSTAADLRRFLAIFRERVDEVPSATRKRIAEQRESLHEGDRIRQTYRRLSIDHLLGPSP